MPEEVLTIVKIPLSEIEESIREKHTLPSKLTDVHIEGDNLVLSFTEEEPSTLEIEEKQPILPISRGPQRIRRPRKKRNRMKTRGWVVVGRITNSKGQKCSIYKPFVDALQNQELSVGEQRRKVESILKSNRNRPSEESIQYFLDNTLEYLKNSVNGQSSEQKNETNRSS
jgi:hypothetical protein